MDRLNVKSLSSLILNGTNFGGRSLHDNPAIAVKMNERINRLFDERYWKVTGFHNTLHLIYVAICAALIGFGLPFFVLPGSHIAIPLFFTLMGVVGYSLMYLMLFKQMSHERIRNRIIKATEETEGTVISEIQGLEIHQVTYTYTVDEKNLKQGDYFAIGQHPRVGEKVKIRYHPKNPKQSYIAESWSEPADCSNS